MTPAAPTVSDRLRAIPTPFALALIAGASFFGVPFVAGLFWAGTDTAAQANPAPLGRNRRTD